MDISKLKIGITAYYKKNKWISWVLLTILGSLIAIVVTSAVSFTSCRYKNAIANDGLSIRAAFSAHDEDLALTSKFNSIRTELDKVNTRLQERKPSDLRDTINCRRVAASTAYKDVSKSDFQPRFEELEKVIDQSNKNREAIRRAKQNGEIPETTDQGHGPDSGDQARKARDELQFDYNCLFDPAAIKRSSGLDVLEERQSELESELNQIKGEKKLLPDFKTRFNKMSSLAEGCRTSLLSLEERKLILEYEE